MKQGPRQHLLLPTAPGSILFAGQPAYLLTTQAPALCADSVPSQNWEFNETKESLTQKGCCW